VADLENRALEQSARKTAREIRGITEGRREKVVEIKMDNFQSIKTPLLLTFCLRIFYSAIGALCAPYLKLDPVLIQSNDLSENIMTRDAGWLYRILGVWERFDTLWYIHIAEHGYDRPESIVFYPLYPLLIRILSTWLRQPLAAALVISTVATFFLFWGFQKLLTLDLPGETVRRALLIYAVWPASFTLFAGYPDGMMTALIIWAVYAARRGGWRSAGALGLLAGFSKAAGGLVIFPLVLIAWRARNWRAWPIAACLLAPLTFTLFTRQSGYPAAAEVYAVYWNTRVAFPWETLWESLKPSLSGVHDLLLLFNLLTLLLVFAPAFGQRIRPEYTVYSLTALVLFLLKRTEPLLQSTSRYALAVFPAFAGWALLLKHAFVFSLALMIFLMVNIILLLAFFEWALVV
jgi:hypothetical protein